MGRNPIVGSVSIDHRRQVGGVCRREHLTVTTELGRNRVDDGRVCPHDEVLMAPRPLFNCCVIRLSNPAKSQAGTQKLPTGMCLKDVFGYTRFGRNLIRRL
jgi:hypothetical protein